MIKEGRLNSMVFSGLLKGLLEGMRRPISLIVVADPHMSQR
jgi:hypothetical protein